MLDHYHRHAYDYSVRTQSMMTSEHRSSETPMIDERIEGLVRLCRGVRNVAVFTGAGISTESGIPDYRGPNGVWATQKPPTLGDFRTNEATRRSYWQFRKRSFPELISHRPNVGHLAITRLFDSGIVSAVVTQNIDGLHQEAGVPDRAVIELHGSARRVHCLDCGRVWDGREIQQRQDDGEELPICRNCGGPMRAQTVLFGESLPPEALRRAIEIARTCELMLVVGSSLVVQPAASVPLEAVRKGIPMAIINLSPTPLDDLATIRVPLPAGATLTALAEALTDTQR